MMTFVEQYRFISVSVPVTHFFLTVNQSCVFQFWMWVDGAFAVLVSVWSCRSISEVICHSSWLQLLLFLSVSNPAGPSVRWYVTVFLISASAVLVWYCRSITEVICHSIPDLSFCGSYLYVILQVHQWGDPLRYPWPQRLLFLFLILQVHQWGDLSRYSWPQTTGEGGHCQQWVSARYVVPSVNENTAMLQPSFLFLFGCCCKRWMYFLWGWFLFDLPLSVCACGVCVCVRVVYVCVCVCVFVCNAVGDPAACLL